MELPLPIELPWKPAATTQHLLPDGPADTTLALYYYQPTLESIAADYPDDYLVYLKFTVSISPISIVILGKSLVDLFSGGLPGPYGPREHADLDPREGRSVALGVVVHEGNATSWGLEASAVV